MRAPIKQYQAQWERYVTNTACLKTAIRYSRALQKFLDNFPDKGEPNDFSRMDVMEYRATRRKEGQSATHVNYEIGVVSRFWRWLIDMQVSSYNPASGVKALKAKEILRESFGEQQQEALYAACLNDRERLLVGLALTSGLRGETMAALDTSDFDLEHLEIAIPPEKMKTSRAHRLPIREQEAELVRALPEGSLWGDWGTASRNLRYRWDKIRRRAQVSLKGLRSARRTAATTLLRQGADIRIVQQWLGHRNISQTQKYCVPAGTPELRAALARMPGDHSGKTVVQP